MAALDPEHVRTFWRTQKRLTPSGIRSPDRQVYSVVAIPSTLSLAPQITGQKEKYRDRGGVKGEKMDNKEGNKRKKRELCKTGTHTRSKGHFRIPKHEKV